MAATGSLHAPAVVAQAAKHTLQPDMTGAGDDSGGVQRKIMP